MRISEIIVNKNGKTMDRLRSNNIDKFYDFYVTYQNKTEDFIIPANNLYDKDTIYKIIYYLVDNIDVLKEQGFPDDSQIIIALNELLEYFNKK